MVLVYSITPDQEKCLLSASFLLETAIIKAIC